MPGGPLSALHGEDIVPIINNIRKENDHLFSTVVQVRDIHCPDDVAFASQHPGTKPFQTITLYYNKKGKISCCFKTECCIFSGTDHISFIKGFIYSQKISEKEDVENLSYIRNLQICGYPRRRIETPAMSHCNSIHIIPNIR